MKKLLPIILVLALMLSFAACTAEDVSKAEDSSATESDVSGENSYTLGFGVIPSVSSSKTGSAAVTAMFAAVITDSDGKVVACKIDEADNKLDITDGVIADNATETVFKTKQEIGSGYGMGSISPIGKEWFEQANAFADYCVGKTVDEIKAITLTESENGNKIVADLSASCTVDSTEFLEAVVKAVNDAGKTFTCSGEASVGIVAISSVSGSSASATDEADGSVSFNTEFSAVAVDSDGKVLAGIIDAIQPKITFNTAGEITLDENYTVISKRELGKNYGMSSVSPIGKDWHEQVDAFADYCIGKTSAEISAIELTENSEGNMVVADLSASCTIGSSDLVKVVAAAAANAD